MIELLLLIICIGLTLFCWKLKSKNSLLKKQNAILQQELEVAIKQLAEYQNSDKSLSDGMLQRAIEGLVALGVPGLILAVAISVSGFTGAAAITTALAVLGGPFGMLGGISVLLLLVLVSKVIAKHGISRIVPAVIKGLIAKGESQESIQSKIRGIPQWIISSKLRDEIQQVINQNTKTLTARSSS